MTTKQKASRGAGHAGNSSQAKGAQGWRQLNSPSGETVETKSAKKEPSSRSKPAQPAKGAKTSGRTQNKKPAGNPPKATATKDTAIINWVLGWPQHIKQGVVASVLLLCTLLFAISLVTRNQPHSLLAHIGTLSYGLFGWGSYLLAIGLAAFAIANLAEAAIKTFAIRWGLVIELTLLGCLLVLESRLLFGGNAGALVGSLLAEIVSGLPAGMAQHIAVLGAMLILLILIFRITWSQAFGGIAWLFGGMGHLARSASGSISTAVEQRRQARAASGAMAVYDDTDPDYAPEQDDKASLPATTRAFPRLPRRAGSAIALEEDDDFDNATASGRSSIGDGSELAAPSRLGRAAKQAALPGMAQGAQPQLPPLPMKSGRRVGSASGAQPAVGIIPASHYELPAITLLNGVVEQRQMRQEDVVEELAARVERTLRSFRVDAEVRRSDISVGPTVIRIGIRPVEKVKRDYRGHVVVDEEGEPVIVRTRVSRIMALQNDLALDLEAKTIRMEAPVPGRPYVGVEIPNKQSRLVTLRELLASKEYEESRRKSKLTVALGRDVAGRARVGDLSRFPHLLIAGATGSGKSVCVNSIIACMLMQATPEDVRFLMVDPKMVELTGFNGIPHLLAPVVTEVER
ncbi:MAG TPA: DNA translocase FtsK, partial [Ktedonobacterales bacterium]